MELFSLFFICLSIQGWPSDEIDYKLKLPSLYTFSNLINTNLVLSSLSLIETILALNPTCLAKLYQMTMSKFQSQSLTFPIWHSKWFRMASFLIDHLVIKLIRPRSDQFVSKYECYLEFGILAQKWQDRCLPVGF